MIAAQNNMRQADVSRVAFRVVRFGVRLSRTGMRARPFRIFGICAMSRACRRTVASDQRQARWTTWVRWKICLFFANITAGLIVYF